MPLHEESDDDDRKDRVNYSKLVCVANAMRELTAGDPRRALPSEIFGLLQECHRLSEAIEVEESASHDPISLTRTLVPHPTAIVIWRKFPQRRDEFWDEVARDGNISCKYVLPSPAECDVALDGMESVSSAKDVYIFRHMTVYRYMRVIWKAAMADEGIRERCLDKCSDMLADDALFRLSELDIKIERGVNYCVFYLVVGRQRIPLCFVQYVAPQHLSVEQIAAGFECVQNGSVRITEGETHDPFLAALFQAYGNMVHNGTLRGIVDTGQALMFLKVTKNSPGVLKIHRHILYGEETPGSHRYGLGSTVLGEYIALATSSMRDRGPTQEWWYMALRLETCKVNAFSIIKRARNLPRLPPLPSRADVVKRYQGTKFCTSGCLMEVLAGGTRFDPKCPNKQQHDHHGSGLDAFTFMNIVRNQVLRPTPETELQSLHLSSRGHQYMRGTIPCYGYTFLVKLAEFGHEAELDHELEIYKALAPVQGRFVPVCIGMLDLSHFPGSSLRHYGTSFRKMLVLSWEGLPVPLLFGRAGIRKLQRRRAEIYEAIEELGLEVEGVLGWKHFLWNQQSQRLILKNL